MCESNARYFGTERELPYYGSHRIWVTESGKINLDGNTLTQYPTSNGMIVATGIKGCHSSVAAFILMTWGNELPPSPRSIVRFRDGDAMNIALSNLYWGTRSALMLEKSSDMRLGNRTIYWKRGIFGNIQSSTTMREMTSRTGLTNAAISAGLSKRDLHVSRDNLIFSYDRKLVFQKLSYTPRELVMISEMYIETADGVRLTNNCSNITMLERHPGICGYSPHTGTILDNVRKNGSAYHLTLVLVFVVDGIEYRIDRPTQEELDDMSTNKFNDIIIEDLTTGEIAKFKSISKASKVTRCKPGTLGKRLSGRSAVPFPPHHRLVRADSVPPTIREISRLLEYSLFTRDGKDPLYTTSCLGEYAEFVGHRKIDIALRIKNNIFAHSINLLENNSKYRTKFFAGKKNVTDLVISAYKASLTKESK